MKHYLRRVQDSDIKESRKNKNMVSEYMIDLRNKIEFLNKENVDEDKFWGLLAMNNEETFDYGRDILKETTYDQKITLPYKPYPLFTKNDWYKNAI